MIKTRLKAGEKRLNKRYTHVAEQKNKKQNSQNNDKLHSDYSITV